MSMVKQFLLFCRCSSSIGRVRGRQFISIGRGCEGVGTVIHEIFHALGRWHEQGRPDRDQFVEIVLDNIRPGVCVRARVCVCVCVCVCAVCMCEWVPVSK